MMNKIRLFFSKISNIILVILGIGLPLFIYLGFIREDPIFEAEYDIEIGRQSVMSIKEDSIENPVLPMKDYPEAYAYMQNMVKEITSSKAIQYANIYKYDSIQIINRDDILNAFCTPGGYIYVYTGLIKYLDHPDHLAGVIGHEIGHAENRHSAVRLQKEFGREKILDYILFSGAGLGGYVKAQMLSEMLTLDYSRDQEDQADEYSVIYLKDTRFACNGASGFFKKLVESGDDVAIPEFLSDHPDSKKRIANIEAKAQSFGCSIEMTEDSGWEAFKSKLPSNQENEDKVSTEEPDKESTEEPMEETTEGT